MSLVRFKECAALSWDAEGSCQGVRLRWSKAGRLEIVQAAESSPETPGFPARLAEVHARLATGESLFIALAGDLPGAVAFEIVIPHMPLGDVPNAIRFELPQQVPLPPEELVWGYRLLPVDPGNEKTPYRARILAVPVKAWNEFVDGVAASKVKADFFIHPFMAIEPLLKDIAVSLPAVDRQYAVSRSPVDKTLQIVSASKFAAAPPRLQPVEFLERLQIDPESMSKLGSCPFERAEPCLLAAAYVLAGGFESDRATLPNLPRDLIPVRFTGIKVACLVLGSVLSVFVLGYAGRAWFDAKARLDALEAALESATRESAKIRKEAAGRKALGELAAAAAEADAGTDQILPALHELTKQIPKGYWIQSFSQSGDRLELRIIQAADSQTTLNRLKESNVFQSVVIKNSARQRDETTVHTAEVVLKSVRLPAPQEGK